MRETKKDGVLTDTGESCHGYLKIRGKKEGHLTHAWKPTYESLFWAWK